MKGTEHGTNNPKSPSAGTSSPARVLIVDDHPAVREGIVSRISRQPDLIVCGEAATVAEALRLVETTQPDVVVIDISLTEGNGIDLIKRIRSRDSSIRMLVCSMHPDSLYAERALRAGALGYINKDNTTGRILDAIRSVRNGEIYLSEDATRRLVQKTIGHPRQSRAVPGITLRSRARDLQVDRRGPVNERDGRSTSSERSHRRYLPPADPAQAEHSERGGAHAHGDRMGPCRAEESELK